MKIQCCINLVDKSHLFVSFFFFGEFFSEWILLLLRNRIFMRLWSLLARNLQYAFLIDWFQVYVCTFFLLCLFFILCLYWWILLLWLRNPEVFFRKFLVIVSWLLLSWRCSRICRVFESDSDNALHFLKFFLWICFCM